MLAYGNNSVEYQYTKVKNSSFPYLLKSITNANGTMDSYYYYDGFSNLVQVRDPASGNQQTVKDLIYDGMFRVKAESQKKILEYLDTGKFETVRDLAKKIDLSTAMLYRALDELKDMDFVSTDKGLRLTDAGKIARL